MSEMTDTTEMVVCENCGEEARKDDCIPYSVDFNDEIEIVVDSWIEKDCCDDRMLALFLIVDDEDIGYEEVFAGDNQEDYEINGEDYMVLITDEVDQRLRDYYGDDTYFWKESVEADRTELGFKDWVESCVNDAEYNILASNDEVDEIKVNNIWYYVLH